MIEDFLEADFWPGINSGLSAIRPFGKEDSDFP